MPGGIGIFGGTFDPIHLGHLRGAEEVREALALDEVRFVPAAAPPHRRGAPLAPANHRYRMVELGIADVPGFRSWDVELARPGPSYSVDTLRAVRAEVGTAVRVAFVLGFDAFRDFETWKEHATLFTLCDVVVMTRPPWPQDLSLEDIPLAARKAFRYDSGSEAFLHESGHVLSLQRITSLDISATAIRARVAAHRSIRFLVPCAVERYIAEHRLYRQEDGALTPPPGWERALACTRAALDRKAYDLVVLEVGRKSSIADYFVICSGRSDTQVQAIVDGIDEELGRSGVRPLAVEGMPRAQWALMDYGDVVVHVFYVPVREFYDLERLWIRAPRVELPEPFQSQARAR